MKTNLAFLVVVTVRLNKLSKLPQDKSRHVTEKRGYMKALRVKLDRGKTN
jgi:hypothetical protein